MLKLIRNQSDLSLATLVFLLAGGVFCLFGGILFRSPGSNSPWVFGGLLVIIVGIGAYVFFTGYALNRTVAGAIITIATIAVLILSLLTSSGYGAVTNGLYFFIIFVYMVWFLPEWFARVMIYPALLIYAVSTIFKFGNELLPVVISILLSTIVFGEIIASFKGNLESSTLLDPLTGTWNTRGLKRMLGQELLTSQRNHCALSVMFIDLDQFKTINDTLGHREGDRVLRKVVSEVLELTRPRDMLFRVGGDEFLLVLPETTEAEAHQVGIRMQHSASEPWSFGVAQYDSSMSAESLIEEADRRMFAQKVLRAAVEG